MTGGPATTGPLATADDRAPAEEPIASWPAAGGDARIVFLLDAASGFEERRLRAWIDTQCPSGLSADRFEILQIPASRRRRGRIDGSCRQHDMVACQITPAIRPRSAASLHPMYQLSGALSRTSSNSTSAPSTIARKPCSSMAIECSISFNAALS